MRHTLEQLKSAPRRGTRPGGHDARSCAADAYVLEAAEGEALWFADALVSYKATGTETDGGLTVAEVRAPRGAGSPRHRHHHEDEAWYILSGELTFWLGDEERTRRRRRLRLRAAGVEHRFRVDSEEARFLLLLTPAGFEDFTRTCGWPATALTMPPADLPERPASLLQAAAARHGLDIVPDPASPRTRRRHAMITTYKAAPDIDVLTSTFAVPGFGLIPINAFVLHAAEPVLVDTGAVVESDEFMAALRTRHRSGRPA